MPSGPVDSMARHRLFEEAIERSFCESEVAVCPSKAISCVSGEKQARGDQNRDESWYKQSEAREQTRQLRFRCGVTLSAIGRKFWCLVDPPLLRRIRNRIKDIHGIEEN